MDTCIIFCVGALAAMASEAFWYGASRLDIALWGGTGMLLLRRILLRFPFGDRVLLCLAGAVLLAALRLALLILYSLRDHGSKSTEKTVILDIPSFTYGLYRFFLIPPAFSVIEYLETHFGI